MEEAFETQTILLNHYIFRIWLSKDKCFPTLVFFIFYHWKYVKQWDANTLKWLENTEDTLKTLQEKQE